MKRALLWSCILLLAVASGAWAGTVPGSLTFISVANPPPKYDYDAATYGNPVTNNNQYYIKFQGGGLNAEYITTDPSATSGQNTYITTNKNSASGSFYLEDNGGRGFTDNAILMLSISGPIESNFSVNINASGYTWQASPVKNLAPTSTTYVSNVFGTSGLTLGGSSFIYGPQADKPAGGSTVPFYATQPTGSTMSFMFIDLDLGMLKPSSSLINSGDIEVSYSFAGLSSDVVAFNLYGWCYNSNQGEGINWTNPSTTSSYAINDTARSPVPVPPSLFLLAGGLGGLGMFRRNRTKKG